MKKYIDNNSLSNYKFNINGLRAIIFIGVVSSLASIGFLVIGGQLSVGFKIFLNLIWFPFIGLGYCVSAIALGFNIYTDKHLTFKQYIYKNKLFYFYFYIAAFIIILIFVITLVILQNKNDKLLELGITALKEIEKDQVIGWGTDPYKWYGYIFLYTLFPTQNYNIIGTSFIVSLFWFNLFGFLIINFLNKSGFAANTLLIVTLISYCFFTHISSLIANEFPTIGMDNPWLSKIHRYSSFINTISLFYFGLYMRKYMRIWKFKFSVLMLSILTAIAIVAQTILDFKTNRINKYNFALASGYASPLIFLLSWLWINSCVGFNLESKTTKNKFINSFNKFSKHIGFCYPLWFQLAGWTSRFIYGYLILHIIFGIDVEPAWYPLTLLRFATNQDTNNILFSFLIIFNVIVIPFMYYLPAKYLLKALNKIDTYIQNKRKNKISL
ncbi:hypothetical protein [Mycoplasma bradburyae]|uniref:Uncharacterized protein n=1 Tax=Mycoplasma bradburyae TaxID=2963128 RepID=A0ABT5GB22_9MOLU|nr:hypothetical protein [Mycoplasma bradburyae]MDC4163075.1 hypothetical protein [Mycoplasma bradburyae]MDC4181666.1 hypothetical protein [Mycoplasma bradburyae]MDC4183843.1 hypothetical protein [Mycoplasma bradburyae]UTS69912.1 hypothetical protein NMG68_02710 [Mycoplasma bradburyae]